MKASEALHVVVGLGATGLSCVEYLCARQIPVAVVDSRANPPQLALCQQRFPQVPIVTGGFDTPWLTQASRLVVSPGVSQHEPAIAAAAARGAEIIGDVELFARAATAPIVAITGSNGKTTVTTLVGQMLEAVFSRVVVCGNIGLPVLQALDVPEPEVYVCEISSFQLDTTYSLNAKVATVLNISPDHLDRYATLADYQRSKQRIFQQCEIAVLPSDQLDVWHHCPLPKRRFTFGLTNADFHCLTQAGTTYLAFRDQVLLPVSDLPLQGEHHIQNALAALALAFAASGALTDLVEPLRQFAGLPHRCQRVAKHQGVTWFNDSKGTNVGACRAALATVGSITSGKVILLLGGVAKEADVSALREPVAQYVQHVVTFGQDGSLFQAALRETASIHEATTLESAVQQAALLAQPGDSVLLSPACASFDMFKNYEHRGEVFMQAVTRLFSHD